MNWSKLDSALVLEIQSAHKTHKRIFPVFVHLKEPTDSNSRDEQKLSLLREMKIEINVQPRQILTAQLTEGLIGVLSYKEWVSHIALSQQKQLV